MLFSALNVEFVQLYSKLKLSATRLLLTDYNIVLVLMVILQRGSSEIADMFSPKGRGHTNGSATYNCTSPTQQGKNVQAYRTNNGVYLYISFREVERNSMERTRQSRIENSSALLLHVFLRSSMVQSVEKRLPPLVLCTVFDFSH